MVRRLSRLSWLVLAACATAPAPVPREQVEPQATRASEAIGALRARLLVRLTEAASQGGPAAAISVCSTEAGQLTAQIATERGVELGRTSARLRNPANAARAWAAATVNASAGRRAAGAPALTFDLGDRVAVLEPIPVGALCVTCHGPKASLSAEVTAALAERYPGDGAVGFVEGDLRGYFWAEVRR